MKTNKNTSPSKKLERDSTKKKKKRLLEALEQTSLISLACQKAGVAKATYYRWIAEDYEFYVAAQNALYDGNERINDLAKSKMIEAIAQGNLDTSYKWLNRRDPTFSGKPAPYRRDQVNPTVDPKSERELQSVWKMFKEKVLQSQKKMKDESDYRDSINWGKEKYETDDDSTE